MTTPRQIIFKTTTQMDYHYYGTLRQIVKQVGAAAVIQAACQIETELNQKSKRDGEDT